MAVRIFVEKENELLCTRTKKHLLSSSTAETSLLQTPKAGKFLMTPRLQQSARKALGDVNCILRTGAKTDHPQKKGREKVHKTNSNVQTLKTKPTEKMSISDPSKCHSEKLDDCPEIETLIPFDPFDFEDFNIPEEHRISHNCLAGLSLFFLEKEGALMEKVLNKVHSPMKWPSLPKLSGLDFENIDDLADLNEFDIELPSMEYDF
ncbi:securin-like [Leucoraja erinacea]|uniref:securin-like n=1 Tax=Leucoraja erinaceus TaxID=7782 RepID=UPI002457D62B|nr:securin-like [Leucoraja erinacea]XP_055498950.1 securin-like [Leucoraja erinacea]XP_055498951.1 securin-like [Leucoraja erinacea]